MSTKRSAKTASRKSKPAAKKAPARTKKSAALRRGAVTRTARKAARPANGAHLPSMEKAVRELVYRTCLTLDRMDFKGYMSLCHPSFKYVISTYSPELRKDIIWLKHDHQGMKTLFDVLPKHVSDQYLRMTLSRHATVYTVDYNKANTEAKVVSGVQVFSTNKDGGETTLMGIAKFYDTVSIDGDGAARLLDREVRLDTRLLGETGCHIPF